jgi:dihydrofolate reductase
MPPRKQRKIVVLLATSADGFIARRDGAVDWLDRPMPRGNYGMNEFDRSIDTVIMGRKTYDFAREHGMPAGHPGARTFVFSTTLKRSPHPNVTIVKGDVPGLAKRLRSEKGKDIWLMGGGEIIASFVDAKAVDEFIIHVIPVFIGEGIPLLAPRHRTTPLKLLATRKFSDGVVQLHYAVGNKRR